MLTHFPFSNLKVFSFFCSVYHSDVLVGAICCRREVDEAHPGYFKVYIMTLGVLKPYRRFGLGSKLLEGVIDHVKQEKKITHIYLHVQINNEAAINFYTKKFNFVVAETIENYYKKIEPHQCYLLNLNVHDAEDPSALAESYLK
jgi:ribosomal protein S18 acetylase RimI-like enzyme